MPHSPTAEIRISSRLNADQAQRREECIQVVQNAQRQSIEAAVALATIQDQALYVEDGNFETFAKKHFGIGSSRVYQLARAGRLYAEFEAAGIDQLPQSEAHIRPLTKLGSGAEQREAWERAIDGRETGAVTMEDVQGVVREMLGEPRISGSDDDLQAVATELCALAPDEFEAGRLLHRMLRSTDVKGFERFVREDLGRSMAWAETAMDYSKLCEGLAEDERPNLAEFERHEAAVRPLARQDQVTTWQRLAQDEKYTTQAVKAAIRETTEQGFEELGVDEQPEEDPAGTRVESPSDARPFTALIDVALLEDTFRERVEEAGELVAPNTAYLPYDELPSGAEGAVIDAMREERDMPDAPSAERKRLVFGQRAMVRVGFEPDLATWAWPVLVPDPRRFPRTWLPEPDAPAPCVVPGRFLQPTETRRRTLSAEDRRKRLEEKTYLVDDEERYQSRVVLLAPGVDLMHSAANEGCIRLVLEHAAESNEYIFLAVALAPTRLARYAWPANVLPVVPASTPEEAGRAVRAFAQADAQGVLLVQDATFDLDGHLRPENVQDHLAAVLVRGDDTSRRALQSILALRRHDVRVQIGRDVAVQEVEPVFDPALFRSHDTNGKAESGEVGTERARLPGRRSGSNEASTGNDTS